MSSTINAGTSGLVLTGSTTTTLSLATNGTTRATIDASGNVGIGTATPIQTLEVKSNNAYGQFTIDSAGGQYSQMFFKNNGTAVGSLFTDNSNNFLEVYGYSNVGIRFYTNNGERMRLDTSGNLGIGTASPSSKLSVGGNPPTSGVLAGVSAADGISLALSDNTNNSLYVKHVSGGAATIGTDGGGQLAFATNGFTERMRIDSSGNVGIGAASPGSFNAAGLPLVVGSGSGNNGMTIFSGTASYGGIHFADGTTSTDAYRGIVYYQHSNDSMQFWTSATERFRISSDGSVGIGTASPTSPVGFAKVVRLTDATSCSYVVDGAGATAEFGISGGGGWLATNGSVVLRLATNGTERFRIGELGQFGVGGANYGTSGQVLTSNGSGSAPSWQTLGGSSLKSQTFTSSGTFTVPTGITSVWVTMVGGGGSGGGGASNVQTAGGGAGGYTIKRAVTVTPGASVSVTVGGGGAGVLTNGSQGNNGSASSFGSVSVSGGGGGNRVNGSTTLSAGTTGVGGANGGSPSNNVRLPPSSIGGVGGLFSSTNQVGGGAGGLFGNGTDGAYLASTSNAGANTGAGSGGASDSASGTYSSGNGGSGMVIVEWIG